MRASLSNLRSIDVSNNPSLNDESLQAIVVASSGTLAELNISNCGMTDKSLAGLGNCEHLHYLDAAGIKELTDASIGVVMRKCKVSWN